MTDTAARTAVLSRPRALTWLALGAGVAAGLGQVPFTLVPLALAGLALACRLCLEAKDPQHAARMGFLVGIGYFGTTLNWIVEPFLVDIARHGWMAPFALVLIAAGFALFWALAFAVARGLGQGGRGALGFAVALGSVEMMRSYILTGFPWALVGYVWSEGPAAQIGALMGPFGLTVLTTLCAACVAQIHARRRLAGAAALLVAWIAPIGAGWALLPAPQVIPPEAPVIRIVQPNAPQAQKWDPRYAVSFVERQLDYTRAEGSPDLVVWSETAVPYWLEDDHPILRIIAEAAGDTPVILGIQRLEGVRAFNSLVELGPDGAVAQIYDKHHLVPFGEFVPLGGAARWLGLGSFAARDGFGFSPGPGAELLDLGRLGRVLPLICYEAIFPQDVAAAPARPDWLLQITNDAWFGTFSGPYQHLAQARMRAIEQGLPMIRVANTGVSAVIDAAGRVRESLPLGVAGFLDAALPPPGPPTLYARSGDAPVALLLLASLLVLAALRARLGD